MSAAAHVTQFDTLTPAQAEALKALAAGATITAAAEQAGVHRSTIHLWTRNHPAFARTLLAARQAHQQDLADTLLDELAALSKLASDTFRQILSDPNAPAATRLKAAMEIVKLAQSQRPTDLAKHKLDQHFDRVFEDLHLAEVATSAPSPIEPKPEPIVIKKEPVRNAPCPCGSRLKYKRCCGNPLTQSRAS